MRFFGCILILHRLFGHSKHSLENGFLLERLDESWVYLYDPVELI